MDEPVAAELSVRRTRSQRRGLRARGWIFSSGALAALAIVLVSLVVLGPLFATRTDLRTIATSGVPLQSRLVALRSNVVDAQFFIERQLDAIRPGVAPDPAQLAIGAQLLATQSAQAVGMSRELRRVRFTSDARNLDAAMSAYTKALAPLAPVAAGKPVDAGTLRTLVSAERTAVDAVWAVTTQIGGHLSQAITAAETSQATDHLALGLLFFLTAGGVAVLAVLGAAITFGRRAGHRDRRQRNSVLRHAYESRVQEALEMTKTEADVYGILGEALHESVPKLKVELLIADSSRAHFRRALTNGEDFEGCGVVSPLDCPAATVGHAFSARLLGNTSA